MGFGWRNSFPERIAGDGRTAETVKSKCTGKWEETQVPEIKGMRRSFPVK